LRCDGSGQNCSRRASLGSRESNIAPATVIALISVAYLEEDGLLLCFAFVAAVVLISVASAAVWGTIVGVAAFISRIL
jgi:hypothetical protein